MTQKTKSALRITLSILLVVGSLYYAQSGIDLGALMVSLKRANYWWVLATIPVILFSHWLRALRWKTMLKPTLKDAKLSDLFSAVMVGYAVNNVLPKGGEFLRPLVFSRREKVSFSLVMATIILERFIFDMPVTLMMAAGVFLFMRNDIAIAYPNFTLSQLTGMGVLVAVVSAFILVLVLYPSLTEWILQHTIRRYSQRVYLRFHQLVESFRRGFEIVKSPSQYYRLILESLAIWFVYIIPMWMTFYAFGFDTSLGLDFGDATFLFIIGTIAFILPAPGGVGLFHTLVAGAMIKLYRMDGAEALAYATLTHGVGYLITSLVGGFYFIMENKGHHLPVVTASEEAG
ncbi:MAG: flippase-like domain-containing protein [Ignavibacteriae bacterium]|nr:flippase-like domain-containing protein [Ignavibacteriota bacterium]